MPERSHGWTTQQRADLHRLMARGEPLVGLSIKLDMAELRRKWRAARRS